MIIPFIFGRESLARILNSEVQSCALRGTTKGLKGSGLGNLEYIALIEVLQISKVMQVAKRQTTITCRFCEGIALKSLSKIPEKKDQCETTS